MAVQDEFQVRFWKLRQSEYEAYTLQCSPAVIRQVLATHPSAFCPSLVVVVKVQSSGCIARVAAAAVFRVWAFIVIGPAAADCAATSAGRLDAAGLL